MFLDKFAALCCDVSRKGVDLVLWAYTARREPLLPLPIVIDHKAETGSLFPIRQFIFKTKIICLLLMWLKLLS